MKKKMIIFVVAALSFVIFLRLTMRAYARYEVQELGQVWLAKDAELLFHSDQSPFIFAEFQIPEDKIRESIEKNNLKVNTASPEIYFKNECLHEGKNRVDLQFDTQKKILKIQIETPDDSGSIPCPE